MKVVDPLWQTPPTDLTLSANDIHIWRVELDLPTEQIEQLASTLSTDEGLRADRFYFERDKKHFIAGRGMLRKILGRYLDLNPAQIQFSYSPRGKPALANLDTNRMLGFNLSHSKELALYGISRSLLLGIDLEYMRPMPDAEQLAQRFFSPREYTVISTLPNHQKQEAFFNGWTCKEAYLKATGQGLIGLADVEVSLIPGEPARLLSISGDTQIASRWSLHQLIPAPDYVAALAVEGQDWHFEFLNALSIEP